MTNGRARWTAPAAGLALAAAGLAWGAWALRDSATAVVLDVERLGLGLAGAGALLAGAALLRLHRVPGRRWARRAGTAAAAAALIAGALLAERLHAVRAEEVRFTGGAGELAGTLFLPRAPGPHPAAVLVHGSGPETRRAYVFYARFLARRGIGALAYDKRGTGGSGGALYGTDYAGYAADARAALRHLAARPEVDASRVGFVGWSEAEWVVPQAAAGARDVRFVVVIGASGTTPAAQVAAEMAMRLRARGHGGDAVARALALNEQVYAYQRTGAGADALRNALRQARGAAWFADAGDLPEEVHPAEHYAWWRSVMDYDASPAWRRVRAPVLLLKGGRDDRSPPGPMRTAVTRALAGGGNDDVAVHVFPEADHGLLRWPLGAGTPPPSFAPGFPDTLAAWIRARVGPGRR